MPRPRKWRKVCSLPERQRFGPLDAPPGPDHTVTMSVDEYETIRLIDLEGMNQEECADKMHVARTTVQGIYFAARRKVAEALVNGKVLRIEGGQYELCDGRGQFCGAGGCSRHGFVQRRGPGNARGEGPCGQGGRHSGPGAGQCGGLPSGLASGPGCRRKSQGADDEKPIVK